MAELFEVVFKGEIKAGADQDEVKHGLADLFDQPLARIDSLFGGHQVVIKSGIDRTTALRYQADMAREGAVSYVHSVGVTQTTPSQRDRRAAAAAQISIERRNQDYSLSGVFASLTVCPRCGHEQLAAEFCSNCHTSFRAMALEEKRRIRREKILAQRRAAEAQVAPPSDDSQDASIEVDDSANGAGAPLRRWQWIAAGVLVAGTAVLAWLAASSVVW